MPAVSKRQFRKFQADPELAKYKDEFTKGVDYQSLPESKLKATKSRHPGHSKKRK